jgi:hypothetical protein
MLRRVDTYQTVILAWAKLRRLMSEIDTWSARQEDPIVKKIVMASLEPARHQRPRIKRRWLWPPQ